MFDIGFTEVTLIAVIGLLVIGPQRLPRVARDIGLWVGRIRRYVNQVRADIEREVRAEELREIVSKPAQELKEAIKETEKTIKETEKTIKEEEKKLESDLKAGDGAQGASVAGAAEKGSETAPAPPPGAAAVPTANGSDSAPAAGAASEADPEDPKREEETAETPLTTAPAGCVEEQEAESSPKSEKAGVSAREPS